MLKVSFTSQSTILASCALPCLIQREQRMLRDVFVFLVMFGDWFHTPAFQILVQETWFLM